MKFHRNIGGINNFDTKICLNNNNASPSIFLQQTIPMFWIYLVDLHLCVFFFFHFNDLSYTLPPLYSQPLLTLCIPFLPRLSSPVFSCWSLPSNIRPCNLLHIPLSPCYSLDTSINPYTVQSVKCEYTYSEILE